MRTFASSRSRLGGSRGPRLAHREGTSHASLCWQSRPALGGVEGDPARMTGAMGGERRGRPAWQPRRADERPPGSFGGAVEDYVALFGLAFDQVEEAGHRLALEEEVLLPVQQFKSGALRRTNTTRRSSGGTPGGRCGRGLRPKRRLLTFRKSGHWLSVLVPLLGPRFCTVHGPLWREDCQEPQPRSPAGRPLAGLAQAVGSQRQRGRAEYSARASTGPGRPRK